MATTEEHSEGHSEVGSIGGGNARGGGVVGASRRQRGERGGEPNGVGTELSGEGGSASSLNAKGEPKGEGGLDDCGELSHELLGEVSAEQSEGGPDGRVGPR